MATTICVQWNTTLSRISCISDLCFVHGIETRNVADPFWIVMLFTSVNAVAKVFCRKEEHDGFTIIQLQVRMQSL